MKRNTVLYIAVSLDGYISEIDGSVNFLNKYENDNNLSNYNDFLKTIDTLLMGRITYNQIIHELSPKNWPYQGKKSYITTNGNFKNSNDIEFISGDIIKFVEDLKLKNGKDIWLVGGGKLINYFIKANAIDKYIINIIPTILGNGIKLFSIHDFQINLKLTKIRTIGDIVEITYFKKEKEYEKII